jgi:acetyltransferase-like isoleucine patch superfamily enzyme
MASLYHSLAQSDHPAAKAARRLYWGVMTFTLPAPKLVVKPMLWAFVSLRAAYYFAMRVFVCEPLFKAYCGRYGRGVRTGVHIHWIMGRGDIVLGDNVEVDGKCSFIFASRFTQNPTFEVGDHTTIRCSGFVIGRRITIGRHCLIAGGVSMFDSNGHPSDPAERMAGMPPRPEDVRPITIKDNVWVGQYSIITPGVTIGEGSIVSAGSVVVSDVPPYTVVAGYPARKIGTLRNPHAPAPAPAPEPSREDPVATP